MKYLLSLLVAMSTFLILGAGNAAAEEPKENIYSPHAVWDDWFDKDGNRIPDGHKDMDGNQESARTVATESMDKGEMSTEVKEFDFLQETIKYDHSKDRDSAS